MTWRQVRYYYALIRSDRVAVDVCFSVRAVDASREVAGADISERFLPLERFSRRRKVNKLAQTVIFFFVRVQSLNLIKRKTLLCFRYNVAECISRYSGENDERTPTNGFAHRACAAAALPAKL